jgi:guanyl-specific ribonuclease Sa
MDPAWVAESAAAAIYFVAVVTTGAVVVGGTVTMADAKGEKKPNEPTDPVPQKAKDVADYASKHGGAAQQGYVGNRPFQNDGRGEGEVLPQTDSDGKPITYKEYDVNPYTPGVNRGAERVVIGSDGSKYYTDDHYKTFKKF